MNEIPRTQAAQRLYTYIMEGLLGDIIVARESYELLQTLGQNSDALMASSYVPFFDAIDRACLNNYLLAIARMYDEPSPRYEIRSIPNAIRFIELNELEFPVLERPALVKRLTNAGLDPQTADGLSDVELTRLVISHFRRLLPRSEGDAGDELSLALDAVRARRDKRVAHSEHTDDYAFPPVMWSQAESLVRFAETFLDCVAFGYLRLALATDDGDFMLGGDAGRSARAFRRLLEKASIVLGKSPLDTV